MIRLMTIHQAKGLEFPLVIVRRRRSQGRLPRAGRRARRATRPRREAAAMTMRRNRRLDGHRPLPHARKTGRRRGTQAAVLRRRDARRRLSDPLQQPRRLRYERARIRLDEAARRAIRSRDRRAPRSRCRPATPLPQVRVTSSDPEIEFKPLGASRGADLLAIVEEARDLAASGGGIDPADVGPIPPDATARRQFSVSRLSGKLIRPDARESRAGPARRSGRNRPARLRHVRPRGARAARSPRQAADSRRSANKSPPSVSSRMRAMRSTRRRR